MNVGVQTLCTAFEGFDRIESGRLAQVALRAKEVLDRGERGMVLIFDDATGTSIEVDFRGTYQDVLRRLADGNVEASGSDHAVSRGPGRPKLGVVAREVTLLPRHWDWLNRRPGGASVALRKLVDEARHTHEGTDRIRAAQEAAYRFMTTIAGDLPGFEEATRAVFAANLAHFEASIREWPVDVRDHAKSLSAAAFQNQVSS